jgi:hypothetical protein
MKTILLSLALISSFQAQAGISAADTMKVYSFKFSKFQGEVFEYQSQAGTQTEAFERAAQACFDHFKNGRRISMDYGQDIIDICVNPRST